MSEKAPDILDQLIKDPSQTAGNIKANPLEVQHAVMGEVLPIFDLQGEEFNQAVTNFVDKRVSELSATASNKPVGYLDGGTEDFIGPQTPMVLSALLSRDYFLDDNNAYTTAFGYLKGFYERFQEKFPDDEDKAYINAAIHAANIGQVAYFQSYYGNARGRANATADIVSEDVPESVSISELKGVAQCQERAGVAHDTLMILGITSRFEVGEISVKNEDGSIKTEPHGFLTVTNIDGAKVIFDPTNPVLHKNPDGTIKTASAAVYKMPESSVSTFTGHLKEYTINNGRPEVTSGHEVTFTFKS